MRRNLRFSKTKLLGIKVFTCHEDVIGKDVKVHFGRLIIANKLFNSEPTFESEMLGRTSYKPTFCSPKFSTLRTFR